MKKELLIKRRRAQLKTKRLRKVLIFGGSAVIGLGLVGLIAWNNVKPLAGGSVPLPADATDHVAEGDDPGPYSSNPPTSGRHYGIPLQAGFYGEGDPITQIPYPEGYILHNLEHGYVVLWYNCELLDEPSCTQLKSQIQTVIDDFRGVKLIGFPRAEMDFPLALTSWGQLQTFTRFEEELAKDFIRTNRYQAPEPNAP